MSESNTWIVIIMSFPWKEWPTVDDLKSRSSHECWFIKVCCWQQEEQKTNERFESKVLNAFETTETESGCDVMSSSTAPLIVSLFCQIPDVKHSHLDPVSLLSLLKHFAVKWTKMSERGHYLHSKSVCHSNNWTKRQFPVSLFRPRSPFHWQVLL